MMLKQLCFILVEGITKSTSSVEQESLLVQLLRTRFPQSHCHTYSPFTGSDHAATESDVLEESARSLLQEIDHLVGSCSLHQKHLNCDHEIARLLSNDVRIIFLGHDLGGSVIKRALVLATEDSYCQRIAAATIAIFFFGAIHRARESDPWERQIINLLSVSQIEAKRLFGCIQNLPIALDAISDGFASILGSINMFSVYESRSNAAPNVTVAEYSATQDSVVAENFGSECRHTELWDLLEGDKTSEWLFQRLDSLLREKPSTSEQYHNFVRDLTLIDPKLHQVQMRMSPLRSTDWIMTLDNYMEWQSASGVSFLYIYGRTGSGATVLTSNIVRILDDKSAQNKMCYLSFSLDKLDAWNSSDESMVLSLVRQILSKRPQLFQHTRRTCTWITNKSCFNLQTLWSLFRSLLSHMTQDQVVVAIYVDQRYSSSDSNIIDRLLSLRDLPNLDMKVIVISEGPDLAQKYSGYFHLIKLEEEKSIRSAVKALVRRRLQRLLKSRPAWRDLDEAIIEKLWTSAPNYYWAMAKVQELERQSSTIVSTKAAILEKLEGFSSSNFEYMVSNIPEGSHSWLLEAFRWIVYSLRPLTSSELAVAVAFNTDDALQTVEDRILSDLPGDINRIAGYWVKVDDGRVDLTNTALKKFVVKKYMSDEAAVHIDLLKKCLRYITWMKTTLDSDSWKEGCGLPTADITQYDLVGYAALYWPYHFKKASRVDSRVVDEVLSFLRDNLKFWSVIVHKYRPHAFSVAFLKSPIQVSAIFGLAELLDRLHDMALEVSPESWLDIIHESMNLAIEQGHVDISLKLYRKMPKPSVHTHLHNAAKMGCIELIEEILCEDSAKSLIDIQDASGYTPLLYAAQCGHKSLVELLLSKSANPRFAATDNTESTALHLASRIGHVEIARVLIDYGADPKSSDCSGYDALKVAAEGGFDELVCLLAPDDSEETEEEEIRTQTPLHLAAMYGHKSTCTYLIAKRVNVNALNGDNETPLHLAVRGAFRETVQGLLEAGSRQLCGTKSPMQLAAQSGNVEIVLLLLEYEDSTTRNMHDINESISEAAVAGHWDVLNLLLQTSDLQNPVDSDGNTALHLASKNGHADLVSKLLSSTKFDPDFYTSSGMAAMHLAAQAGSVRVLTTFIHHGIAVDCVTADGDKPVHFASKNGHLSAVKALQAEKDLSAEQDHEGNTPLILAARGGHVDVMEEYISVAKKREDVDPSTNWKGSSLLHEAVSNQYMDLASVLIEHGFPVDSRDPTGDAPLHVAARDELVPMIQLLIKRGADTTATNIEYETALCLAVKYECLEACKAIVESSADKAGGFINIGDKNTNTPLYIACENHAMEITQLLLEKNADPNQKCSNGWTPLHVAAAFKGGEDVNLIDSLLKAGADHSVRNGSGSPAIIVAAEAGNTDAVQVLLDYNADPNMTKSSGSSALHRAAKKGHLKCVEHLVVAGAEYDVQMKNGMTPLHCAITTSQNDIVTYLVHKGADVNIRSDRAGNALELAMREGDLDIAKILLDAHATMVVDAPQLSSWNKGSILTFALEYPSAFTITSMGEALQHAIEWGNDRAASMLIDSEMDLNEQCGIYCTALQAAAYFGSLNLLKKLLERGAKHDIVGGKYGTALNAAVTEGLEVVELLLNEGADPDGKDLWERTSMMNAVLLGELDLAKVLLRRGANPDAKDNEMKTPLSRAIVAEPYSHEMALMLLDHGADPSLKDCRGKGPLYWACLKGRWLLAIEHIIPKLQAKDNPSFHDQLAFHAASSILPDTSSDAQLTFLDDLLLAAADNPNLNEIDLDGWTALYTATRYGITSNEKRLREAMFLNGVAPVSPMLKRPSEWHLLDKSPYIQVSDDGKSISVKSLAAIQDDREEPKAVIRANHCMPGGQIYYFEVDIEENADKNIIGVGFCEDHAPLDRMLGWDRGSWGYHGDDGKAFSGWEANYGSCYGDPYKKGDTIGCGVNFEEETAYFTKNGKLIGPVFRGEVRGKLYPAISFECYRGGGCIQANFGSGPFHYEDWKSEGNVEEPTMSSSFRSRRMRSSYMDSSDEEWTECR